MNYEIWIAGCDDIGIKVYPINMKDDVKLFKLCHENFVEFKIYYDVIGYAVWDGDEMIYNGDDYQSAYKVWLERT